MTEILAKADIPVVILCGGMGTRLREASGDKVPKPLVDIGGRPILWHIMKIYREAGFRKFVLCLGYKGDIIRDYFVNYELRNCDVTVTLGSRDMVVHNTHDEQGWRLQVDLPLAIAERLAAEPGGHPLAALLLVGP